MTLLIASVHGEIPTQLTGANLLEIRIDSMDPDSIAEELPALLALSPIPTIVTCRSVAEGGMFEGEEEERVRMYRIALECKDPPRYLDVEHEALTRHPLLLSAIQSEHTGIILSWHDVDSRPRDLLQRAKTMQDVHGVDVVKIVWRARSVRDNIEAFDLLQTRQQPMVAMCMGEYGIMSRVLAPKFGGFATYASINGTAQTAPGQPTLSDFCGMYNFSHINKDTNVYGVIGNNVAHSSSPVFHNTAFQIAGKNAVYIPIQIPEGWEHLKASVRELQEHEQLHFTGASVTIPHKENMMRLADTTDAICTKVGAVNTITMKNGEIHCDNTDVTALIALCRGAKKALVLGGGGVARSAIVALQNQGAEVSVSTRRIQQAQKLAKEFSCSIADYQSNQFDTIINCTPIGMEGGSNPEGNPIEDLANWITLDPSITIIETVYKPTETPFVLSAKTNNCTVITGGEMFRIQAVAQQEIWNG